MTKKEMEITLHRLADLAKLAYSKEAFWQVKETTLLPPASPGDIDALSSSRPFPLPPLYKQFLSVHNGALNFWPKYALLGTEGEPRQILEMEIEDARQFANGLLIDTEGKVTDERIAAAEHEYDGTGQPPYFYLPAHTVFATNGGGQYYFFNERNISPEGEAEVVKYTHSARAQDRYPSFGAFLNGTLERLQGRIEKKGYLKTNP